MGFQVDSNEGMFCLGKFTLLWGNRLTLPNAEEMGGYFCLTWNNTSLEFGEIDQGGRGIYFTTFSHEDWDVVNSKTLVRFPG